jgi:DNA replication protein DnaC
MPKSWQSRYLNPHTRPDPDDALTKRTRIDAKRFLGKDALEEEIDFLVYLADLRRRMTTPEHQAIVAERIEEDNQRLARQADFEYRRSLERLSPFHVDCVRSGCDGEFKPITTTDIQRKVMAQWDGTTNLFLLGETGIGKTYTATWCAMRAARRGESVAATTALRVCEASKELLDTLRHVGTLALDQLHTLRSPAGKDMPAWQVSPVIDLIDYRYEHKKTIIAAGTIAIPDMVGLLGKDVIRRFPLRLASKSTGVRK